MRYLFFDIECANCDNGIGKICSFGYVVCDSNFNILSKEDILINPNSKFSYGVFSNKYITLGYPIKEFLSKPKFDVFYPKIKELLSFPDQIIIGHAVDNDVNFLLGDCERYNLPCIKYDFYDSQELYRVITNNTQHQNLCVICEQLGLEIGVAHRSDDDAEMTKKIVQKLCSIQRLPLEQLLEKYPSCHHKMSNLIAKYNNRKVLMLFKIFLQIKTRENTLENEKICGKTFCFSRKIENVDSAKIAFIIQRILDCGGFYSADAEKCDCFVRTKGNCDKLYKIKDNKNIKIITFGGILYLLNLKWDSVPCLNLEKYLKTHLSEKQKKLFNQ